VPREIDYDNDYDNDNEKLDTSASIPRLQAISALA